MRRLRNFARSAFESQAWHPGVWTPEPRTQEAGEVFAPGSQQSSGQYTATGVEPLLQPNQLASQPGAGQQTGGNSGSASQTPSPFSFGTGDSAEFEIVMPPPVAPPGFYIYNNGNNNNNNNNNNNGSSSSSTGNQQFEQSPLPSLYPESNPGPPPTPASNPPPVPSPYDRPPNPTPGGGTSAGGNGSIPPSPFDRPGAPTPGGGSSGRSTIPPLPPAPVPGFAQPVAGPPPPPPPPPGVAPPPGFGPQPAPGTQFINTFVGGNPPPQPQPQPQFQLGTMPNGLYYQPYGGLPGPGAPTGTLLAPFPGMPQPGGYPQPAYQHMGAGGPPPAPGAPQVFVPPGGGVAPPPGYAGQPMGAPAGFAGQPGPANQPGQPGVGGQNAGNPAPPANNGEIVQPTTEDRDIGGPKDETPEEEARKKAEANLDGSAAVALAEVQTHFNNRPGFRFVKFLGAGVFGVAALIEDSRESPPRSIVIKRAYGEGEKQLINEIKMLRVLRGGMHFPQILGYRARYADSRYLENIVPAGRIQRFMYNILPTGRIRHVGDLFATMRGRYLNDLPGPSLVMQLIENGSFEDFFRKVQVMNGHVPNRVLWSIALCFARMLIGMAWPPFAGHKAPERLEVPYNRKPYFIQHNDIHYNNVMFGDIQHGSEEHSLVPQLKLIDFGRADYYDPYKWLDKTLPRPHIASDAFKGDRRNTISFGLLLQAIITKQWPQDGKAPPCYMGLVRTQAELLWLPEYRDDYPWLDPELKELVGYLMAVFHPDRLPVEEILARCERGLRKRPADFGVEYEADETDAACERFIKQTFNDAFYQAAFPPGYPGPVDLPEDYEPLGPGPNGEEDYEFPDPDSVKVGAAAWEITPDPIEDAMDLDEDDRFEDMVGGGGIGGLRGW